MNTVNLVANAIKKYFSENAFDKMVILNTEKSEKYQYEYINIFRKYIKTNFSVESLLLDEYGKINSKQIIQIFSNDERKIVDLSNGQKTTAAMLYMAASLCNIEDIYYLNLLVKPTELSDDPVLNKEYTYIKMDKFKGTDNLAHISYFDLVYYKDEVNAIFDVNDGINENSLYNIAKKGLLEGITAFFQSKNDYRTIIYNVTSHNERLIGLLLEYLRNDKVAKMYSAEAGVNLNKSGDPVGILQYFFNNFSKDYKKVPASLIPVSTVPSFLSTTRVFRNYASHNSQNMHTFTLDEARIIINIQLETFKCLKRHEQIWKKLMEE